MQPNVSIRHQSISRGEAKYYSLTITSEQRLAFMSAGNSDLKATLYKIPSDYLVNNRFSLDDLEVLPNHNSNSYRTHTNLSSVYVNTNNFMIRPGITRGNGKVAEAGTYILKVEPDDDNHNAQSWYSVLALKMSSNGQNSSDFFSGMYGF